MRDFESRASASSATPALVSFEFTLYTGALVLRLLRLKRTMGPEATLIKPTLIAALAFAGFAFAGPEFEAASVTVHPMAPNAYMIKNFTHGPPFVIPTSNRFTDTIHTE